MSQPLLQSLDTQGVLTLTLNSPQKRNALSVELREALKSALYEASENLEVAAVVLMGAGGHFCAGGDISTMGAMTLDQATERMSAVAEAAKVIAGCKKPIVVAVEGHASGAGVSLALLADVVIASDNAKFTFSFLRAGLGPDWGLSYTLPLRVGPAAARRLLLSQSQLSAAQALQLGLIDAVVNGDGLADEVYKSAAALAGALPNAINSIKQQMADLAALEKALRQEAAYQVERFTSDEHRHAIEQLLKQ